MLIFTVICNFCYHKNEIIFVAGLVEENFLIVADASTLYQLDLGSGSAVKIHEDPGYRILKVAFDPVEKKIYWTNGQQMRRANLNGTGNETIYAGEVHIVDVDPVSRLVYCTSEWAYYEESDIYAMTLDGRHHFMIIPRRPGYKVTLHPTRG